MNKNLKKYVKGIDDLYLSEADKDSFIRFCKKEEYINGLMEQMYNDVHCKMHYGYGDYDASVVFVYEDNDTRNKCMPTVNRVLNKYLIDTFSVYNTLINKCDLDYPLKYVLLSHELNAVKPLITYFICEEQDNIGIYNDTCSNNGIEPLSNVKYLSPEILMDDKQIDNVCTMFKVLITKKKVLRRQDYVKTV